MATTWTVGSGDYIRPYRCVRTEHWPEGASQTFRVGDPVILSTVSDYGNHIVIAGTDAVADIVGFAAEAATGVTGTKLAVWVADESGEFVGRVQDTGALDNDQIGEDYGMVADGTNHIWRVDLSDTTNVSVQMIKFLDTHGDTNGRVVFKVLNAARSPLKS